ncbi:MAG: PfkB family carbohydrate kinase [Thiohalomonadaceae bacterium]
MARILGVGNVTLDIVNVIDNYPHEDQEVRALSQHINRGGNTGNTLAVLNQLGHDCAWAGTLADERDAELIRADLHEHRIDLSAVHTVRHGKVPTSYISLSRLSGSRTIVHYRDLPEYQASDFARIDLGLFDWLHVEGRNIDQIKLMLQRARAEQPNLICSLEVEKARDGIEQLFPLVDMLMFSRDYVLRKGWHDPGSFLQVLRDQTLQAGATCTWGDRGAYALSRNGEILHEPAFKPKTVVDTLGAGDVFNAGLIDQLVRGHSLDMALIEASRLAGRKCGVYGLKNLVD